MSLFTPTDEQRRALEAPTPLLVLAGAGTGKTTTLTRRIAQTILSDAARPDQVLALTFTDKAAAEMAERLAAVMAEAGRGDLAHEVAVSTFHSFGGSLIRENLLRLGFERPPGVLTAAASWRLLAAVFDDLTFDSIEVSTGQVGGVFARLLGFFSRCKDHLVDPDRLDAFLAGQDTSALSAVAAEHLEGRLGEWRDAAQSYRRYEEAKREAGAIDFGDHLHLPAQLLLGDPGLRETCRARFRHIFVDEYQDTNHAQRMLLLQLLDPAAPRIMVIGDDDQAIYRWRGAVVHNILRFPAERLFREHQVEQVPLTLNRRSYPPILDLANLAIQGVSERHAKKLAYHADNGAGRATVGHYTAASDTAEARWIAERIAELEPKLRDLPGAKRGYGACAVLCRKRRLFEPVGQALEAAGIPCELVGGTGFYGRPEIRDLLSYLRVIARAGDDLAMARILRSPRWRISGRDIHHLGRWVAKHNGRSGRDGEERPEEARFHLLDAVRAAGEVDGLSTQARERLQHLGAELDGYAAAKGKLGLANMVSRVLDGTGYRAEYASRPGFEARVALLNLAKLEHLAAEFAAGDPAASLADFVEYVTYALESGEEEGEVRPVDEGTNTVKVMTVHQAKGLEFPVVFVPGLAQRLFPSDRKDETQKWWQLPWELRGDREHLPHLDYTAIGSEKELKAALEAHKGAEKDLQLDEERRLFYVALTRAQQGLYLSRAHWYGTTVKPRLGSEFWDIVTGSDLSANLGDEDCPAQNPNGAQVERLESSSTRPGDEEMALLLGGEDPGEWLEEASRREGYDRWLELKEAADAHLARVDEPSSAEPEEREVEVSVSGLLLYLACPRHYRYVYVDRLPVRPSPYAALGREVHRRIEELSRPAENPEPAEATSLAPEEEDERELAHEVEELLESCVTPPFASAGAGASVEALVGRFKASPYGQRPATYVEFPFAISIPGGLVRGRIDRLDRLPDGGWDLVDFKSGRHHPEMMAAYRLQLSIYAMAVCDLGRLQPGQIDARILFLGDGSIVPVAVDERALGTARAMIGRAINGIAREVYNPCGEDSGCQGCDYAHLCLCAE
ncbi:MAG: UvrD-helicase domain-containing protein [Chloroflexi bacterium]|nr:UvrD-helicase domain-containing protein [Chloroflexota bacterium]